MRFPNAPPEPTPTPLLSLLTPPLPPGTPASSIIRICLFGVLYFLTRSLICLRYVSENTGRKLQSCLIRPVNIVVLARGFTSPLPPPEGFVDSSGSLGRSATTIWLSTDSLIISSSYESGSSTVPDAVYVEFRLKNGRVGSGGCALAACPGGMLAGGRKSTIRGFLPVGPAAL
jgi:hypothetical protein